MIRLFIIWGVCACLYIVYSCHVIHTHERTIRGLEQSLERTRAQLETETRMNQKILEALSKVGEE